MDKTVTAIVTHEPTEDAPVWATAKVKQIRTLEPTELLVRMIAAGICHSDIVMSLPFARALGVKWPIVLGHEGAGIVEDVGSNVDGISKGDRVILSYDTCQECYSCRNNIPTRCEVFNPLNLVGQEGTFETENGTKVAGQFFGQSSFAELSVVKSTSAIVVNELVEEEELKLLAPLGCGLMTGAGSVCNEARAGRDDVILITGLGAVGLGALLAAKNSGCKGIIAIDRVASRLQLAKELGAHYVFNTSDRADWTLELKEATKHLRISVAVETTGNLSITQNCFALLGRWGKLILIGAQKMDSKLELSAADYFFGHKTITSTIMGGGHKKDDIVRMIKWWRDGVFPLEKFVKFLDARTQFEAALHGMEDGSIVKPVLVW